MTEDKYKNQLSVVIASGAGGDFLFHCLESLKTQIERVDAEVIVVDRCGTNTLNRIRSSYPFVITVATPPQDKTSVPALRKIGVEHAKAEIVAIIEEHCTAAPNWASVILEEFRSSDAAIGGPIMDSDYQRIQDWVVFFSEYHNYLAPWLAGKRYLINGVNIAYNREILLRHKDLLSHGYWEVVLHPALAGEGDFRAIPNMVVHHNGPFSFGYYLQQRYLLSRVWGGAQRKKVNLAKRLAYLLLGPIIPVLLLLRMASRVIRSKRYLGKFILAVPLLVLVLIAYVWGEWLGYLMGEGDALKRVE